MAALVLGPSGCSLNLGHLSALSTQNMALAAESHPVLRQVEGRDCVQMILFIPLGSLSPNIQEAMDRALAQAPEADALRNVVLYVEPLPLILYNQSCLVVKGEAVKAG